MPQPSTAPTPARIPLRRVRFDRPFWLEEVRAAKADAWAKLSPVEAREAKLAEEAWRERKEAVRKERIRTRRGRMRRIVELFFDGRSAIEVANEIGVSIHRLRKITVEHGVLVSWRPGAHRKRTVAVDHMHESALRRLAADAGVDPSEIFAEIVGLALEQDAQVARQLLRIDPRKAAVA